MELKIEGLSEIYANGVKALHGLSQTTSCLSSRARSEARSRGVEESRELLFSTQRLLKTASLTRNLPLRRFT
jgi:hypothetical protein